MKTMRIALALALILVGGTAWAGKEAYRLVMSKDKAVCSALLALFNDDMKKHGSIQYDYHKIFVSWKPTRLPDEMTPDTHCGEIRNAILDINNDGKNEILLRTSLCWHSVLTDTLFIFPSTSDVLAKLTWANMGSLLGKHSDVVGDKPYELKLWPQSKKGELLPTLSDPWVFEPLVWNDTAFIVMTDRNHGYVIVIAKYKHGATLEDSCYFEKR